MTWNQANFLLTHGSLTSTIAGHATCNDGKAPNFNGEAEYIPWKKPRPSKASNRWKPASFGPDFIKFPFWSNTALSTNHGGAVGKKNCILTATKLTQPPHHMYGNIRFLRFSSKNKYTKNKNGNGKWIKYGIAAKQSNIGDANCPNSLCG